MDVLVILPKNLFLVAGVYTAMAQTVKSFMGSTELMQSDELLLGGLD